LRLVAEPNSFLHLRVEAAGRKRAASGNFRRSDHVGGIALRVRAHHGTPVAVSTSK